MILLLSVFLNIILYRFSNYPPVLLFFLAFTFYLFLSFEFLSVFFPVIYSLSR